LEFLGIEEKAVGVGLNPCGVYSERDLENAVTDSLESFLLELGKGFLFEARQKRFTLKMPPLRPRGCVFSS
jgi:predicted nuclease of restriction endonuclease-like (RecB) superfamily